MDDAVEGARGERNKKTGIIISIVNTIHYIAYLQVSKIQMDEEKKERDKWEMKRNAMQSTL